MDQEGSVDDLLSKLKIPVHPPDRSKWRKLEIAVKFIGKSKTSVQHTNKRRESMKIEPKELEMPKEDCQTPRKHKKWAKVKNSLQQVA
jgi:hypothetical protein